MMTKNFSIPRLIFGMSILALALVATRSANAGVSDDLESLGSNKQVADRAANLESRSRFGIVQGRVVDRHWRFELGASYGPVAYGDSYLLTQNAGLNLDLHINPKVSVGARYSRAMNQLTAEGQQVYDQARTSQRTTGDFSNLPQISYPEETLMGMINWYMLYGKLNFFDQRTIQFDIYSLAGFGQIKVTTNYDGNSISEWNNTWTAGGGIGFWFSNHVSSRFELRYQGYSEKLSSGPRDVNVILASFGIGVLI